MKNYWRTSVHKAPTIFIFAYVSWVW